MRKISFDGMSIAKSLGVLIVSSALVAAAGCDKFKLPGATATKAKTETPAQPVAAPVKGTLIAKVNNIPLTLEDLDQEIEAYNSMIPADRPEAKITTREQKLDYLKNEMVRRALFYQDALDKGLERDEEINKAMEKYKMDVMVMELVRKETVGIEVTSKEVEDAYNQYKEQFKEPEQRQIREIVVPSEREAQDILILLLQGGDFAALATERSKSASAPNGGDIGFIEKGARPEPFNSVAFSDSLEVGKTSSVFKGPDGYYILKLEAKRGGKQRTLSEMWDDIKNILLLTKQREKIDKLVGDLSKNAKIEIYESAIK